MNVLLRKSHAASAGRRGAAALRYVREQCPECGKAFSNLKRHACKGNPAKAAPIPRGKQQCAGPGCTKILPLGARLCFTCSGDAAQMREAMGDRWE